MTDELGLFRGFCQAALVLEDGRPMELEGFQQEMLQDYFDGARETLVIMPKKNGKSTLLAALSLYHLITTPDAECVVGAASRDQATILYDQAAGFVRRGPLLQDRVLVKRGYREIVAKRHPGRIRVLAADVDTADGVIPTLALVDELHRHKSADLYGVFRDGLGPRRGQMLTISTAGAREPSPLGEMRAAALALPDVERDGGHVRARADGYVMHEWSIRKDENRDDMDVVKRANPASWQTTGALAARRWSPSMLPWAWARFACGIWGGSEDWWITGEEWHPLASPERLEPGDVITLGFDGARTGDATALVACRVSDGLLSVLGAWEAPPDVPEWEIPAVAVENVLERAVERHRVLRGYFDPPLWRSEIDQWARKWGDRAIGRYETARTRMLGAIERFHTDVVAGRLKHTGDQLLTRHVLNAQTREARTGGYWIVKDKPGSERKIDAAIAAVLAWEARADALASGALKPRTLVTF